MYKRQRRYHPGYECKWATNTVVHLLENREYTGCLVNFKTEKPSFSSAFVMLAAMAGYAFADSYLKLMLLASRCV